MAEADSVARELAALADEERARFVAPYLGVVPGGYGDGDVLLGIPVPKQRKVARRHRDLPLGACETLLRSEIHEHRFVALAILRDRFERSEPADRERIAELYLANRACVNNWDLVDASAPYLLADRVRRRPRQLLDPLLRSASVWDRRIAVLATFPLIKADEFRQTLRCCEALLEDEHDLIHKATGWMLREVGKRDEAALRGFLDVHAAEMPRTMLRYSIERLPPRDRKAYLARKA
ncbi:MAG TPA: DNA alkylation repair protein [Solirubrobacterales bacterium]|nr:DNA alkylation repair protein [Solirubrobacterales bacterium]